MTQTLTARFTVDGFEPSVIPGISSGAADASGVADESGVADDWVGAVIMRKTYTAGIVGTAIGHFVSSGTEASRGYLCAERITGTLDDGRSGSFTVHHGALNHPDDPSAFAYIIAGTGTAGLASISGHGRIHHDADGPYFVFELD